MGLLFVKQVDRTRTYWQSQVEISVYLCFKGDINPNCHGAVSAEQQQTLQQRLTAMPQVESVQYVTQQEAYTLFKSAMSNEQSLVSTVTAKTSCPLLEVRPAEPVRPTTGNRGQRGPRSAGRRFGD